MTEPILRVENLHVNFGGIRAADDVNVDVHPGERLAIIGPNGSGKTTFLNLCTGYVKPDSGHVYLEGNSITRLTPRTIARRGIARSFQIPQLFTDKTLVENIMLGVAARRGIWDVLRPLNRPDYRREAERFIELVGLQESTEKLAGELPEGTRKLADIAIALTLKPRLLLLDEPTSGVSARERFALMETLIPALREEDVTAVFVEHDMDLVRRYAERVLVWDSGRVIAAGPPDTVLQDPQVLQNVVGV